MPITFSCQNCRKKYRVKDALAGKTAKCGACDTRMKIPAPVAAVAAPLPDLQDLSSGLAPQPNLDDFFDEALSPSTTPSSSSAPVYSHNPLTKSCSSCGNTLKANALLCTNCGFDLRTNKKTKTEKTKYTGPPRDTTQRTASLGKGALFSAICTAMGAAVWLGIMVLTGHQFNWIAWVLGCAAGVGMSMGHDKFSTTAGLFAASISLLGIVVAKFLVFEHVKSMLLKQGISFTQVEAVVGRPYTFSIMFNLIDGLFIVLALASAYIIGSRQATD